MTARRSFTGIQTFLGAETTRGTPVSASVLPASLDITFSPEGTVKEARRAGSRQRTVTTLENEWSMGQFTGPIQFNELPYILRGLFGGVSTAVAATDAFELVSTPNESGDDPFTTFTLIRGDSAAALRATYSTFTSAKIAVKRTDNDSMTEISGKFYGRDVVSSGVSIPSSPTVIPNAPATAQQFTVYLDATFGEMGTTKLTGAYEIEIDIADKSQAVFELDSAQTSFGGCVEKEYEISVKLVLEFNAANRALFTSLSAPQPPTLYLRLRGVGPAIEDTTTYLFEADSAVALKSVPKELGPQQSAYAFEFNFAAQNDEDFGGASMFRVVSLIDSL
jgi:hypothetical protein